jgi:hypothetical protein
VPGKTVADLPPGAEVSRGWQSSFTFTPTCQRLGVEPWADLQDELTRLPSLPAEQLGDFLPDHG